MVQINKTGNAAVRHVGLAELTKYNTCRGLMKEVGRKPSMACGQPCFCFVSTRRVVFICGYSRSRLFS